MGAGWWELTFSGVKKLNDSDRKMIAKKIKEGCNAGMITQEDDPPELDAIRVKEMKLPDSINVDFGDDDPDYFEVYTEIKFKLGQGKKLVENLKWSKEFCHPDNYWESDIYYYEMKKGKIFLGYRTYEKGDRVGIVKDFMEKVLKVKEFLKK